MVTGLQTGLKPSGLKAPLLNTAKDGSGNWWLPLLDSDGHLQLDVLSIVDTILTKTIHPFGKGSLTTDGVQYSSAITTSTDAYEDVEEITVTQPSGLTLVEIEFFLTGATKSSSTTEAVNFKWQASDDGASWEDLCAEQTQAADASSYADASLSGRFAPTGNFLGASSTFKVKMIVKSAAAGGETASAKTKNSSYITCRYRRT